MEHVGESSLKYNDFNACVQVGEHGEELTRAKLHDIFRPVVQRFMYGDSIHATCKQRNGIDFEINKERIDFDVKCRDYYTHKYNDILLETVSIVESNKPGWLYASKSDLIVYAWFNSTKTTFVDGYLLFLNNIRLFIEKYVPQKKQVKYAKSYKNGHTWTTENIAIPISDFPNNCREHINMRKLFPPDVSTFDDFNYGDDESWQDTYRSNRVSIPRG